jgi:hypothetical protein
MNCHPERSEAQSKDLLFAGAADKAGCSPLMTGKLAPGTMK